MSLQMEHRGFTIGRQVGGCGRWARFVLGLLGLAYIGAEVARLGPSALLLERLAGGLLLTTALYLALFWLLGERVSQPWLRTVIFWLPALFILLPGGWECYSTGLWPVSSRRSCPMVAARWWRCPVSSFGAITRSTARSMPST
jgi:hypothetical protein